MSEKRVCPLCQTEMADTPIRFMTCPKCKFCHDIKDDESGVRGEISLHLARLGHRARIGKEAEEILDFIKSQRGE